MELKIKMLDTLAWMPGYTTEGAGAFDLRSPYAHVLNAQGTVDIGLGLAFEIPAGHVMLIFSRSGHGFKRGVRLANAVGVVDSDFRGEVRVKLRHDGFDDQFYIAPGDAVAQAIVLPLPKMTFELLDQLSDTARGTGGFGSTDKPTACKDPQTDLHFPPVEPIGPTEPRNPNAPW